MLFSKRKPATQAEPSAADPHLVCEGPTLVSAASSADTSVGEAATLPASESQAPKDKSMPPRRPKKSFGVGLLLVAALVSVCVAYLNHTIEDPYRLSNYMKLKPEDELKELISLRFRVARATLLGKAATGDRQRALFDLAHFSLHKGDERSAAHYLEQLLRPGENFSTTYADRATAELCRIYMNQGRVREAADLFSSHFFAPSTDDASRASYFELGAGILDKAGRKDEADLARDRAAEGRLFPDDDDDITRSTYFRQIGSHESQTVIHPLYMAARRAMAEKDFVHAKKILGVILDNKLFPENDYYVLRSKVLLAVMTMVEHDNEAAKREFPEAVKAVKTLSTMKNLPLHNDSYLYYKCYAEFLEQNGDPVKAKKMKARADALRQRDDERYFRDEWWKRRP